MHDNYHVKINLSRDLRRGTAEVTPVEIRVAVARLAQEPTEAI